MLRQPRTFLSLDDLVSNILARRVHRDPHNGRIGREVSFPAVAMRLLSPSLGLMTIARSCATYYVNYSRGSIRYCQLRTDVVRKQTTLTPVQILQSCGRTALFSDEFFLKCDFWSELPSRTEYATHFRLFSSGGTLRISGLRSRGVAWRACDYRRIFLCSCMAARGILRGVL